MSCRKGAFAIIALLILVVGRQAHSTVITQAGFSDRYVAYVPGFNGGAGQLVANSGELYVVGGGSEFIKKITPAGVLDFAKLPRDGQSFVAGDEKFYVGARMEDVYEVDTTTLDVAKIATFPTPAGSNFIAHAQGLSIAPSTFGDLGGQLIATIHGPPGVASIDLETNSVHPITLSGFYTDHAFDLDGSLLVLESKTGNVVQVTADGAVSFFAGGFASRLDAIAIHPVTGDIYLADSAADQIWRTSPSGETATVFATNVDFDDGWYPSPLRFSKDGRTLYYGIGETSMTIRAIDGFLAIPEPSALILMTIVIPSIVLARLRNLVGSSKMKA